MSPVRESSIISLIMSVLLSTIISEFSAALRRVYMTVSVFTGSPLYIMSSLRYSV